MFTLFFPSDVEGNNYKFERLFSRHSILMTFDYLRVPTIELNLVTWERELEVEPKYQTIMYLHSCRLLSEEILGPNEYCRFSKEPLGGHFEGHFEGHWGALGGPL